jgi:hypothetical protein
MTSLAVARSRPQTHHRPVPSLCGLDLRPEGTAAAVRSDYFAVCASTMSVTISFWFAALKRASVEFPATAEVTEAR